MTKNSPIGKSKCVSLNLYSAHSAQLSQEWFPKIVCAIRSLVLFVFLIVKMTKLLFFWLSGPFLDHLYVMLVLPDGPGLFCSKEVLFSKWFPPVLALGLNVCWVPLASEIVQCSNLDKRVLQLVAVLLSNAESDRWGSD